MVRFLLVLTCLLGFLTSPGPALAQCTGSFPANTVCGTTTGGIPHPIPPPSSGVSSLNSITGAANITAGSNVTVTPAGQNIQISSTGGGGALNITRAQIPTSNLSGVSSLVLVGYSSPNDPGSGAPMTCVGQTINSPGAIIDSAGNWCAFDVKRINNTEGFRFGWFGAKGDGAADDGPAMQQTFDTTLKTGVNQVYCANAIDGGYSYTQPLFYDPPGSLRGQPNYSAPGIQGFYSPGYVVTSPQVATTLTAAGSGSTATLTFAAQPVAPAVGSTIQVSGVTPIGYNGNFTVISSSTTSVTYANITTGAQSVAGTVTAVIPYVNNTTDLAHGIPGNPPASPDYSGVGMDFAYKIINSTSAVTYNPTYTNARINALAAASFKGSGAISTPVVIAKTTYQLPGTPTNVTTTFLTGALVTVAVVDVSGNGITSVTDSRGNTYTQAAFVDNPTVGGIYIFYTILAAPGITANFDTITVNGPSGFFMIATGTTGITGTPLDKTNTTNNTSSPTNSPSVLLPSSGSFTQANEIVFAAFETPSGPALAGFTESAGFTTTTPYLWTPGDWQSGTTYKAGDVVVQFGLLYRSMQQNNIGNSPKAELSLNNPLFNWTPISVAAISTVSAVLRGPPQVSTSGPRVSCVLKPSYNNSVGLALAPSQNGMTVDSVNIWASNGGVHCGQPGTGAGIVILNGANQTLIKNTWVQNFYFPVIAGVNSIQDLNVNGGSLAAENKFDHFRAANGCIGQATVNTQGFVNSIIESDVEANTNVLNTSSLGTVILGGNYSEEGNQTVGNSYPDRSFPITVSSALYDAGGILINGTVNDGASFTGVISGNTLTASAVTGTINVGDVLSAPSGNIINGNSITGQISGTPGGAGTYSIAYSNTLGSQPMLTGDNLLNAPDVVLCGPDPVLPVHFWNGPYSEVLSGADFFGSISGTALTVSSVASGALAIGQEITSPNVSAYTTITAGGGSNWTLSNSQGTIPAGTEFTSGNHYATGNNTCNQAVYNTWIFDPKDASSNFLYGLIPAVLVSYNRNTHAAKWRVIDEWYQGWGGNWGGAAATALTTALAAQTRVAAVEKARVFVGTGITVDRVHIENVMPYQLVDNHYGFGAPAATTIRNMYIGANPARFGNGATGQSYAAQAFSFINVSANGGNILLENLCCNITASGNSDDNLMIDFGAPQVAQDQGQLKVMGGSFGRFNFRYPANGSGRWNMTGQYGGYGSAFLGAGSYETTPFIGINSVASNPSGISPGNGAELQRTQGTFNSGPYSGVRPAPWTTPCISGYDLGTLLGTLPTIGVGPNWVVPYPVLWSGQQYKVCDWNLTPLGAFNAGVTYAQGQLATSGGTTYLSIQNGNIGHTPPNATFWWPFHYGIVSNHGPGFSLGQNITTTQMGAGFTWSTTNNSPFIPIFSSGGPVQNVGLFWPGLVINLAGTQAGCTNSETFIVREVHYQLGYLAIFRADSDSAGAILPSFSPGSPFVCSNNTIGQSAYSFTNLN